MEIHRVADPNNLTDTEQKHVPVFEMAEGGMVRVKVGRIEHPMTPEHLIEKVELYSGGEMVAQFRFHAGDKPQADFPAEYDIDALRAVSFCNVHGAYESS